MGQYRIYRYPSADVPYKHIYLKRDVGYSDRARSNTAKILEKLKEGERLEESLSRTKRTVTDLALCNPFEYFCTFTFSGQKIDRYNFDVCAARLRKWFDNFRQRYAPDFRYLIIPEFHQDGAVHFHGLVMGLPEGELVKPDKILRRERVSGRLELVPNTPGYMDWPRYSKTFGHFNCSRIRNTVRCALYITKYITKDLAEVGKGRRAILASSGLQRPQLALDMQDVGVMFRPEFSNEYCAVAWEMDPEILQEPDWWYDSEMEDVIEWPYENMSMLQDAGIVYVTTALGSDVPGSALRSGL